MFFILVGWETHVRYCPVCYCITLNHLVMVSTMFTTKLFFPELEIAYEKHCEAINIHQISTL